MSLGLTNFTEKHELLVDSQYGLRSNRSTSMALMVLIEDITSSIDKKKYALGVFIDFKKAFHTIDHHLLINKLEKYGIRGVVLNWMKSYKSKRH